MSPDRLGEWTDDMTGEPLGPELAFVLVAKGLCCLAYIGVGMGLFTAGELLGWLKAGDYPLIAATMVALVGVLWALRRNRAAATRIRETDGRTS